MEFNDSAKFGATRKYTTILHMELMAKHQLLASQPVDRMDYD